MFTKAIDDGIREQWKWNAPSFRIHDDYLYTFMLRPYDHLNLVIQHLAAPLIASELLDGYDADGRRIIYLRFEGDIAAEMPELERVLRALVASN